MKTAIYIQDGVVQLVITPETEFEKNAMRSFKGKDLDAKIMSGSFYECQAGYFRQTKVYGIYYGAGDQNDDSLILRVNTITPGQPAEQA